MMCTAIGTGNAFPTAAQRSQMSARSRPSTRLMTMNELLLELAGLTHLDDIRVVQPQPAWPLSRNRVRGSRGLGARAARA